MKPSEIFEGEKSSLKKTFDEAVAHESMTTTQKVLEAYCKKFGLCKEKGTCQCKKELKFIAESIAQAKAEERERVRGIAKRTIGINTTTRFDEVVYKNGIDVKEYINKYDFLSSLDKPLQVDKDMKKTYRYDKFMQLVTTQEADRNDASIGKCYLCGTLVEQNGNSTSVLKEELKKGDHLMDSIKHRVCKKK